MPILVESDTWIPARLATRWVLLHRRLRSASNTLRNNLFTLKQVYCWAKGKEIDLDELLLTEGAISRAHIKSLVTELQDYRSARTRSKLLPAMKKGVYAERLNIIGRIAEARVAVPIDYDLTVIEDFLSWAADPVNSGVKPGFPLKTISTEQLNSTINTIRATLDAYKVGTPSSRRPEPLNPQELTSLQHAIAPVRTSTKGTSAALLFPRTPWEPVTCLRNWLMFGIALQCGLRIGEILKLTIEDVNSLTPGGPVTIKVLRRPDDPLDTRKHPPAVKTLERVLVASPEVTWGLRLYLTQRSPLGRVRGETPYLFTTAAGDALSYLSAHRAIKVLGKHVGIAKLCWHRLRHTWAESIAKDLLEQEGQEIEEKVIEKLRYLGGWSEKSKTPFHYIRNAVRESANDFLRKRNERMYT